MTTPSEGQSARPTDPATNELRGVSIELARMGLVDPAPLPFSPEWAVAKDHGPGADGQPAIPDIDQARPQEGLSWTSSLPLADHYGHASAGVRIRTLAFGRGLSSLGSAAGARRELAITRRIGSSLPRPLVVGFISAKGGTGCTTAAAGVALGLSAARSDRTAMLGCTLSDQSLAWRLGCRESAPNALEVLRSEAAETPLHTVPSGLAFAEGAPAVRPLSADELDLVIDRVSSEYSVTVLDVGVGGPSVWRALLERAGTLVVVTDDTAVSLHATSTLLAQMGTRTASAWRDRVLLTVTETHRRGINRAAMRRFAASNDLRKVRHRRTFQMPYDRVMALGEPLVIDKITADLRWRYLELAAEIVAPE